MTVRSVVGFQWGHKEAQGVCSGSPLAWRPATSHVGSLYGAAHITEQRSRTLGQKTYLRKGGEKIMLSYLCNWHSTFIYIKGLNPAIGLHCRQTCMALLIWALPAVASLSVQYPVKSAHISTVAEDAIKCTSKTRLCLHNVPVCTCSNTWWPTPGGNCVFFPF